LDAVVRREGTGCCHDGRAALVLVVELLAVAGSLALILELCRHWWGARTAHGYELCGLWASRKAAAASVVGDTVVVDDDGAVIDVGDAGYVDAIDGAVVVEVIPVPVTAVVARACVAEAVVNASVEADVRTPEAWIEAVAVAKEAPVGRGPERSGVGGEDPGSGNPVVADWGVIPVARGPDVVGPGGFGLLVGRKRGWRSVGFEGLLAGVDLALVGWVFLTVLGGVRLVLLRRGDRWVLGVLFRALLALVLLTGREDTRRRCGSSGWPLH
jgi:hypothetical protein